MLFVKNCRAWLVWGQKLLLPKGRGGNNYDFYRKKLPQRSLHRTRSPCVSCKGRRTISQQFYPAVVPGNCNSDQHNKVSGTHILLLTNSLSLQLKPSQQERKHTWYWKPRRLRSVIQRPTVCKVPIPDTSPSPKPKVQGASRKGEGWEDCTSQKTGKSAVRLFPLRNDREITLRILQLCGCCNKIHETNRHGNIQGESLKKALQETKSYRSLKTPGSG